MQQDPARLALTLALTLSDEPAVLQCSRGRRLRSADVSLPDAVCRAARRRLHVTSDCACVEIRVVVTACGIGCWQSDVEIRVDVRSAVAGQEVT